MVLPPVENSLFQMKIQSRIKRNVKKNLLIIPFEIWMVCIIETLFVFNSFDSREVGQLVSIDACFNGLWISKCHIDTGAVFTFNRCGWAHVGRRMMMWEMMKWTWIDGIWCGTRRIMWRMWWRLRTSTAMQCICIAITWMRRWMAQWIL